MKKTHILMNKPVYLGLSVLDLSKTVVYEFWYDYLKPKWKHEKVIGLMKDELEGQIMKEFIGFRAKTCSYLKENNDENKKGKGTKKHIIKRNLKCQNYKNCLNAAKIDWKILM